MLKTEQAALYETTFEAPDGNIKVYETRIISRKENDLLLGLTIYTKDITFIKNAKTALQESENRYKSFIAHSGEGIYRISFSEKVDKN